MEITRANVNELSKELGTVLRAWAQDKGITLDKWSGSFDPTIGQWRATLTFRAETVKGKPREQAEFEQLAPIYDMEPQHYKHPFTANGVTYTLIGFTRKRLPVLGERADGKRFMFDRRILDQVRGRRADALPPAALCPRRIMGMPHSLTDCPECKGLR